MRRQRTTTATGRFLYPEHDLADIHEALRATRAAARVAADDALYALAAAVGISVDALTFLRAACRWRRDDPRQAARWLARGIHGLAMGAATFPIMLGLGLADVALAHARVALSTLGEET